MRQLPLLLLSLGALAAFAQSPVDLKQTLANKRVELAEQRFQRIQQLFDAGAESRLALDQAQEDLADARDEAFLEKSFLSDGKAADAPSPGDVISAAERRVNREQAKLDQAQKLITDGLESQSYLAPFQQELSMRRMNLDLARSHVQLTNSSLALAKLEQSIAEMRETPPAESHEVVINGLEHYDGDGAFNEATELKPIERAFATKFDHSLPISAEGETELHRALGFDHRGRVDVAVNPNLPEGIWLRQYLQSQRIPYYAFSRAIPGKATAAHIHIGPGSTRLQNAD